MLTILKNKKKAELMKAKMAGTSLEALQKRLDQQCKLLM
jgi:hypothetical protein